MPLKGSALVLKNQSDNYRETYAPMEQAAVADINSTDIVDNAAASIDKNLANATGQEERDRRRYGLNQRTAVQQDAANRSTGMRAALNRTDTMNNAVLDQYSRNTGLRDSMINVGRGVESQATQGLIDADASNSARGTANDNAAAARSAGNMQAGAAVATVAITAIIL